MSPTATAEPAPKKKAPKKHDHVRILNTTWTGVVVENRRGDPYPYMVELDEDTMKRIPLKDRPHYEEHYYGPCKASDLRVLDAPPDFAKYERRAL